jgi:coatomer protein complex subunit alpha (xenin)
LNEQVTGTINIAREYVLALKMELARKDLTSESTDQLARAMELAAYFTHCKLQAPHIILSLRQAMSLAYKLKCLGLASSFAQRLLEMGPGPQLAQTVRLRAHV